MRRADEILMELAELFRERNVEYGNTYWQHGEVMRRLFPEGILLTTVDDFTRFGIVNMMVSKMCRLSQNWKRGGHEDSTLDLSVYSAMLVEVEQVIRTEPEPDPPNPSGHLS